MRYQVELSNGHFGRWAKYEVIDTEAKAASRGRIMCIAHKSEADRIASALNEGNER